MLRNAPGSPANLPHDGQFSTPQTVINRPNSITPPPIQQSGYLTLTKAGPQHAYIGDIITYALTVTNGSSAPFTGVTLTDTLPLGTAFIEADNKGRFEQGSVVWPIGILAGNSQRTVQFSVKVMTPHSTTTQSTTTARIIGGKPAQTGAWPWQVSLLDAAGHHKCGGVLIDPEWITTAAHCLRGASIWKYTVLLGQTDLTAHDGQRVNIEEIVIYPHYYTTKQNEEVNDIALIKLAMPVAISHNIAPIDLITAKDEALVAPGVPAIVTGWGWLTQSGSRSPMLQEVVLPIVSNEVCNQPQSYNGAITEAMLCAGYAEGGRDSCQGDSGGPLVVRDEQGRWRLAGLVSFGQGCAKAHKYGVYTRLSKFADWLAEVKRSRASNTLVNKQYWLTTAEAVTVWGSPAVTTKILPSEVITVPVEGGTRQLDQQVTITIQPETFSREIKLIYQNFIPKNNALISHDGLQPVGLFYKLHTEDTHGQPITPKQEQSYDVAIQLYKNNATEPRINRTALYFYDSTLKRWVQEDSSHVDETTLMLTASPRNFGTWAVLADTTESHAVFLPLVKR